jgi:hypothetical protein
VERIDATVKHSESGAFTLIGLFAVESQSKLNEITSDGLSHLNSLKFLCIPASVAVLQANSLSDCKALQSLTFESGSQLREIQESSISGCSALRSLCLPASLQQINGLALARSAIRRISVEDGNEHFSVLGDFLLDFEGISIIRYLGSDPHIELDSEFEQLCVGSFFQCTFLRSLTFACPNLTRIEAKAISGCSSLSAIVVPASVEILGEECLSNCRLLSSVSFESGSRLARIERRAFYDCSSLKSLFLPASLEFIAGSALATANEISVDDGNNRFCVSDHFLLDIEGISVVRYFGSEANVTLHRGIKTLLAESFSDCNGLCSLSFEPGSKLTGIGARAFYSCVLLSSLHVPALVQVLGEECFYRCWEWRQ